MIVIPMWLIGALVVGALAFFAIVGLTSDNEDTRHATRYILIAVGVVAFIVCLIVVNTNGSYSCAAAGAFSGSCAC